jgi:hypothetical protein
MEIISPIKRKLKTTQEPDSIVGIATGYGLDGRGVGVRVLVKARFFSHYIIQAGSGTHPTSYLMGTGGSFLGGKAAGALSWPYTSNLCRGQEYMDLYIHSPICFQLCSV